MVAVTSNTSCSFIGNINPIRYRGYYYDNETGFYYLQTRYYDPTICRFINADNYELVAELSYVPGELNMYAYCGNNPIMYTDPTGEFWNWLIGAAIGAVAGSGGSDFVKGSKLISEAINSVGNAIKKGVHPVVKKVAKKTIKKAGKYIGTALKDSLIEDFVYTGFTDFASRYLNYVFE